MATDDREVAVAVHLDWVGGDWGGVEGRSFGGGGGWDARRECGGFVEENVLYEENSRQSQGDNLERDGES